MLATALSLLVGPSVYAAATSPFASAQSFETAAPKGASLGDGDNGVVEERGAVTYLLPITVPPGRLGMQPSLGLAYSSQAGLRGGVAMGWSLDLPMVELDRNAGLGRTKYKVGGSRLIEVDDSKYVSARDGGSLATKTFRAQYDASFTRYLQFIGPDESWWEARALDGRVLIFETLGDNVEFRLQQERDAFGNTIVYNWQTLPVRVDSATNSAWVGVYLFSIEYTTNPAAGLTAPHAKVTFGYDPLGSEVCSPSWLPYGAELDAGVKMAHAPYKSLGLVRSPLRLRWITTSVRETPANAWRNVRQSQLSYDTTGASRCTAPHAPLRVLISVQETAYAPARPTGVPGSTPENVVLPKIDFAYGPMQKMSTNNGLVAAPTSPQKTARGEEGIAGDYPSTTRQLMDIDGDGITDMAWSKTVWDAAQSRDVCYLGWQRGLFGGGYETTPREVRLPTLHWHGASLTPEQPNRPNAIMGERCSVTAQHRARAARTFTSCNGGQGQGVEYLAKETLGYHYLDWNHDGHVDVLTNGWVRGDISLDGAIFYQQP